MHGLDYYGSFLCIQDKYKFNITDDLENLANSKQFIDLYDIKYTIEKLKKPELIGLFNKNMGIPEKTKITISEEAILEDLTELLNIQDITPDYQKKEEVKITENIYQSMNNNSNLFNDVNDISDNDDNIDDDDDDSSLNYTTDDNDDEINNRSDGDDRSDGSDGSDGSDENDGSDEDDGNDKVDGSDEIDESDGSDDEYEEEPSINAYIKEYPIQMICLEKCNGTIDELFQKGELDKDSGSSALFQIVMILLIYQATFEMTHNDLHTNNIMYINTPEKYLYYYYDGKYYKVPTYGRIYKIIDFGRSIYKYNGEMYCSDSFAPNGDAHTQYNCEPYYNSKKPIIKPNPSFDLCRLGVSIYDFIIDDDDEENPKKMDIFQETINRWCHDDNGKNVLYKSDGSERYPDFSLYKMLSRTVNNHIPKNEIKKYHIFNQYKVKTENIKTITKSLKPEIFINVDKIPCYVDKYY
jgi:hypothetical protein